MQEDKSLKEQIKAAFPEMDETCFGNWCSDLHILYDPVLETWLQDNYPFWCNVVIQRANVKGHEWYGNRFFDIPFAYTEHYNNRNNGK